MKTTSGLDLVHATLAKPPLNIPNALGIAYKTELVVERSEQCTVKINWWHGPDDDRAPHNHPWTFISDIKSGGYTERRWTKDSKGLWVVTEHSYKAGDSNRMPDTVFHMVIHVEPNTTSIMLCGPAKPNNEWGYLDKDGNYEKAQPDPNFISRLKAINPFMK